MKQFANKLALVTGASSGLGVDFAKQLAASGADLVLSARREQSMQELAASLKEKYGVQVYVIAMDLSAPNAAQELYDAVNALKLDKPVEILINNAGFGLDGHYVDMEWSALEQLMQLNMITLSQLAHLYGKEMKQRKSGYIMNLGSIGSFQAAPRYATYAATKAYTLHLSEALNFELKDYNVHVTALCPGITQTEFFERAGQEKESLYQKIFKMKSSDVVRLGLKALIKNKPYLITGYHNQGVNLAGRVAPRKVSTYMGHLLIKN